MGCVCLLLLQTSLHAYLATRGSTPCVSVQGGIQASCVGEFEEDISDSECAALTTMLTCPRTGVVAATKMLDVQALVQDIAVKAKLTEDGNLAEWPAVGVAYAVKGEDSGLSLQVRLPWFCLWCF